MRDKEKEKEKREKGTMGEKREQDRLSYRIKEIQSQQAAILCCYCWRPSQENCGPLLFFEDIAVNITMAIILLSIVNRMRLVKGVA